MNRPLLPDYVAILKGLDKSPAENVGPFTGTSGTAVFRPVPAGLIHTIDMVSIAGRVPATGANGVGGARVNLYRNSIADDAYIGTVLLGATDPAAIFESTQSDSPWLLGGERLLAEITGAAVGVVISGRVDFHVWELRPIHRQHDTPMSGFPAVPDVEEDTPAYDTPDAQDLRDRAGGGGQGAGTATRTPDRAGYGAGALYPDRPGEVAAPPAFPWPDGPVISGGEF